MDCIYPENSPKPPANGQSPPLIARPPPAQFTCLDNPIFAQPGYPGFVRKSVLGSQMGSQMGSQNSKKKQANTPPIMTKTGGLKPV